MVLILPDGKIISYLNNYYIQSDSISQLLTVNSCKAILGEYTGTGSVTEITLNIKPVMVCISRTASHSISSNNDYMFTINYNMDAHLFGVNTTATSSPNVIYRKIASAISNNGFRTITGFNTSGQTYRYIALIMVN